MPQHEQLAMRHPQISKSHYKMMVDFIEMFRPWYANTRGDKLITKGFDPDQDQEV